MRTHQLKSPALRKLGTMIANIGPGMLTFVEAGGQLRSRPMSPLELDNDDALWFFVRESRHRKTGSYPVSIAFSQPDDACYVSVSGTATLVHDHRRTAMLWSPMATLWFAQGVDDPDLALLKVSITAAEYWSARSGAMVRLLPPGKDDER